MSQGVEVMKAYWTRYLNEIVGLTVMVLMAIALVSGQTHATAGKAAQGEALTVLEIRVTKSD